ncbi:MAG: MFS transporter [Clostridia bacterium]|nr:MFS transporter [Clostridia bacterium]
MNSQKATGRHILVTVGIMLYGMLITGVYGNIASTVFSAVAADSSNPITMGQLSGVSFPRNLVIFLLTPLAAKLLKKNAKAAMAGGAVLMTAPFFFQSYFHAAWPFYITGMILGIGGAVATWSALPLMINRWWTASVGSLIGILIALQQIGKAIFTPVVAKIITDHGWRFSYQVLGIGGCVIGLLVSLLMIQNEPEKYKLLPAGAALEAVESSGTIVARSKPVGLNASRILRTPSFYLCFCMAFLATLIMCFQSHEIYYAMSIGFTIVQGAAIISAGGIANYFTNMISGFIVDKLGIRAARWFAGIMGIVSVMLFFLVAKVPSYPLLLAAGIVFGGSFSIASVIPVQVREMFGSRDYAKTNAYVSMGQALGAALGVMGYGLLYDLSQSYRISLILCAVFIVTMLFCGELAEIIAKPLKTEFTEEA